MSRNSALKLVFKIDIQEKSKGMEISVKSMVLTGKWSEIKFFA